MNQENLEYLQERLKYLGFGENAPINEELKEQVLRDQPAFQLITEAHFEDCRMEAKLYFERSGVKDHYYFKRYDALLQYSDGIEADKQQTFYIFKKWGYTFKEAFNLLEGRAVYKKLVDKKVEVEYWAWSELNFNEKDSFGNYKIKEYKESYNYDLEKVLEMYPIIELQDEQLKKTLIRSLQRGNIHPVYFVKNNKRDKVFIEASPRKKTIVISQQATRAAVRAEKFPKPEEPTVVSEPLVVEEPDVPGPESETPGSEGGEKPDTQQTRPPRKRIYK
ncbi:MAG: hypothetical protein JST42_02710 [Bacteroidetes bacterium]|nr:hypothetical protein [Bacteroidota bacterium]